MLQDLLGLFLVIGVSVFVGYSVGRYHTDLQFKRAKMLQDKYFELLKIINSKRVF